MPYPRIDAVTRVAQFVRTTCRRLRMARMARMAMTGASAFDLQAHDSQLAQDHPSAAALNAQAQQVAADRAWVAISRFSARCRSPASPASTARSGPTRTSWLVGSALATEATAAGTRRRWRRVPAAGGA